MRSPAVLFLVVTAFVASVTAQTSTFTYQGRLTDNGSPANGLYSMNFAVYDQLAPGGGLWGVENGVSVSVVNGIFTVSLDFSPAPTFASGADRYLEIAVLKSGAPGYTTLSPRQKITSAPFAIRTLSAGSSDSLSAACVGCVNDTHIGGVSGSKVTGAVANATTAATSTNNDLKAGDTMSGDLNMGGSKITGLTNPTNAADAATKAYVDASIPVATWFQTNFTNGPSIACCTWGNLPASLTNITTTGKPLVIFMNVFLNGGSHATCRPIIDGVWAGSYGGLLNTGDPFWQEGLVAVGAGGSGWRPWTLHRIYPGVPAGPHTLAVQCATDSGTLATCGSSIGCSVGAYELH